MFLERRRDGRPPTDGNGLQGHLCMEGYKRSHETPDDGGGLK